MKHQWSLDTGYLQAELNAEVKYPENAYCEPISALGHGVLDGNIFVHPFYISKVIDYIEDRDFKSDNVFLKRESVTSIFDQRYTNGNVHHGSIFRHFMSSAEQEMKYTYLLSSTDKTFNQKESLTETNRRGVTLTISPVSNLLELTGKHAHMYLKAPSVGDIVYVAGEMLVRKSERSDREVRVFMNTASGTFYELLQRFVDDRRTMNTIFGLVTNMISMGARAGGATIEKNDVIIERDVEPSDKFKSFVMKKPGLIIGLVNEVDLAVSTSIDLREEMKQLYRVSEDFSHPWGRAFDDLSMKDQTKIRMAHRLSINVINNLVRPRVYSSRLRCTALVGLFLNAERILFILGNNTLKIGRKNRTIDVIKAIRLDFMDMIYKQFMTYSIPFADIREGINTQKRIDPSVTLHSLGANKNSFLDFTGLRFEEKDIYVTQQDYFESFVIGEFIASGNFGAVHKVASYVSSGKHSIPQVPLVAKVVLHQSTHGHRQHPREWRLAFMDMFHKGSPDEPSHLMNAFSVDFPHMRFFTVSISEEMKVPDFDHDIDTICRDVLRDIIRLSRLGYVHRDIKPDNIMQRHDGTNILVDMGLVEKTGKVMNSSGSALYSSLELNTVEATPMFRGKPIDSPRTRRTTSLQDVYSLIVTYAEFSEPSLFRKFSMNFSPTREYKVQFLEDLDDALNHSGSYRRNDSPVMNTLVTKYIESESSLPHKSESEQIKTPPALLDWIEDMLDGETV